MDKQSLFLAKAQNKNKLALSSLAMDLKRVAIGYHRGSNIMAKRFLEEAFKRRNEVDRNLLKPHIKRILDNLEVMSQQKNGKEIAEDALMYSTLLQNTTLI